MILKKAIEKAVKNGMVIRQRGFDFIMDMKRRELADYFIKEQLYYPIIFSHSFAKAFFPTTFHTDYCIKQDWKKHLQIMVLEEHPVKYLEKFLKEI